MPPKSRNADREQYIKSSQLPLQHARVINSSASSSHSFWSGFVFRSILRCGSSMYFRITILSTMAEQKQSLEYRRWSSMDIHALRFEPARFAQRRLRLCVSVFCERLSPNHVHYLFHLFTDHPSTRASRRKSSHAPKNSSIGVRLSENMPKRACLRALKCLLPVSLRSLDFHHWRPLGFVLY